MTNNALSEPFGSLHFLGPFTKTAHNLTAAFNSSLEGKVISKYPLIFWVDSQKSKVATFKMIIDNSILQPVYNHFIDKHCNQ